ncbi:LemA family protein [bacterium]|mgnify:CR=1 FL=1|nr:LemA family protein [bacterium]|tara:strand:+ start:5873 stop:6427 length:555 start_codon:yes stop_codon:yes gene_type:complete
MNKKTIIIVAIITVLLLIFIAYPWGTYNSLVRAQESIKAQWQQVETQYQRRFDLIPNLVNSVKGIMEQEKEIFGNLAEARSKYAGAPSAENASGVESALSRLLLIMENYPELRSAETVSGLMAELAGTENRVAIERRRYNEKVESYNKSIKIFPKNILANIFGFSEESYFESAEGADIVPNVEF